MLVPAPESSYFYHRVSKKSISIEFDTIMEVLAYQEEVLSGHSHWGRIGLEDLKDPLLLKFWI